MKRLFAMALILCMLLAVALPAQAAAPAAAQSKTLALLEQMESADAFTISVVLSVDDSALQTFYFKGDRSASDYRNSALPFTLRSVYAGGKGYLFLRGLPLFYLPVEAESETKRTQITEEIRRSVSGCAMQTGSYERDGVQYETEIFIDGNGDATAYAFTGGQLRLILLGDAANPTSGLVVRVTDYAFSAPDRVFRTPLIPLRLSA